MRPFSPEVSRDKWADWRVCRRAGLTFPASLSMPSCMGGQDSWGKRQGSPRLRQSASLGAEGLALSHSSQDRCHGFCGPWGKGAGKPGQDLWETEGRGRPKRQLGCAL